MSTDTTPLHPASESVAVVTLVPSPHDVPHIEETVKMAKYTEILGESPLGGVFEFEQKFQTRDADDLCYTLVDQSSKKISIHSIPDYVLLEIFDLCSEKHSHSLFVKKGPLGTAALPRVPEMAISHIRIAIPPRSETFLLIRNSCQKRT